MRTNALLLPLLAVTLPAKADFLVIEAKPNPPAYVADASEPAPPPPTLLTAPPHTIYMGNVSSGRGSSAQTKPVRFFVASGFGDRVPLQFAVRQLVPHGVDVTYGRGVNRMALVSWEGGRGWSHVLQDVVEGLGLRLVMKPMAVEIKQ